MFGSHITIPGKTTRMTMAKRFAQTIGKAWSEMISCSDWLLMPEAMNMFSPRGGVEKPMPATADQDQAEVDRVNAESGHDSAKAPVLPA